MELRRKRDDKVQEAAKLAKTAKGKKTKKPPKAGAPPFSLRAALAAEADAIAGALALADGAQAVHQTRIALKRVRVLARIADHALPEGGAALEYSAQAMMRRLANARDLAAAEHVARLVREKAKGSERAFLQRAASDFARARLTAEAAALAEAKDAFARLAPIVAAAPETSAGQVKRAAQRLAARARKAYRAGRGERTPLLRHDWRKREKDLRYCEMIMGPAWPLKRQAELAGKLTEALGRERDASLLLVRLASNPHTPPGVVKRIKAFRRARGRRADKIGARLRD